MGFKKIRGQGLIEILIAMVVFAVAVILIVSSIVNISSSVVRSRLKRQAINYAREGIEIAYNLSFEDWAKFSGYDGEYHIVEVGGVPNNVFDLADGPALAPLAGRFERSIFIESARRDSNGDIGGGTLDPNTKRVVSRVVWKVGSRDEEIDLTLYVVELEEET